MPHNIPHVLAQVELCALASRKYRTSVSEISSYIKQRFLMAHLVVLPYTINHKDVIIIPCPFKLLWFSLDHHLLYFVVTIPFSVPVMVSLILAVYAASLLIFPASAVSILASLDDLTKSEFDFVVVGGGTAGLVVATRLSENPHVRVLVAEAGGSNEGVLNSIIPFFAVELVGSSNDWNFTSVPQAGLLNRTLPIARGHLLGGSSSINRMDYTRGSDDLYDHWANLTGDHGWSWSSLKKYYFKNSRLVPPADGHDTTGQVDPSAHGYGPVEVSLGGFPAGVVDDRVVNASKLLGGRFAYNRDLNAGDFVGVGYLQSSVGHGRRSSAAVAYLDPLVSSRSRPNLSVLVNTVVTKLYHSVSLNGIPEFKTVELGQVNSGSRLNVTATKEIILSAGVIGTPHILMLSGIGPKDTLASLGIEPLVDNPSVGQNLTDQPQMLHRYLLNITQSPDDVLRNATLMEEAFDQWNTTKQGLFVSPSGSTNGYLRLPENSTIWSKFEDPSSGPRSAHIELIWTNGFGPLGAPVPATGHFLTINTVVVSPISRGHLTLASSDPFAKPVINPNYLTSDFDVFTMIQAIKDMKTFVSADPWKDIIIGPVGQLSTATTDEQLALYARNGSISINHSIGTARMSPFSAKWGVVDPDLAVKGARGLSVVDASVFPSIPECHMQAPTYIVAERAVDLIKARNGLLRI
ncbi:hypothetical protein QCA50_008367 [Cerrena zonata]|uniref:Uncharacterized protein n=1 Tax=Cerrena zonata TaxID=2478898 RepID=A0AAW0G6G6_9APHY